MKRYRVHVYYDWDEEVEAENEEEAIDNISIEPEMHYDVEEIEED